jgi:hypothetical protein
MFYLKQRAYSFLWVAAALPVWAQNPAPQDASSQNSPTPSETGAVLVYADSGWSFGLPSVQAFVTVGDVSATSPLKKTLIAPSFGVGVRAWKFLMPFADFTAYDTGKATASVGSVSSQVQADTLTINGGLRLIGGKGKLRGYGEFGGGILYQNVKGTFSVGGQDTPVKGTGSTGDVMYGGGVQVFVGKRWGSDIGFDGFHVTQKLNGAGQNFSRIRFGVFFQTKPAAP